MEQVTTDLQLLSVRIDSLWDAVKSLREDQWAILNRQHELEAKHEAPGCRALHVLKGRVDHIYQLIMAVHAPPPRGLAP